jgi:hypothetical protein
MTNTLMARLFGAAALLCAVALPCTAADDDNFIEAGWQTPAAPQDANLLPFYTNLTGLKFAVDAKSLSVDKDGVARYTMIATSRSGAKNISYEGIRCATMEHKLYAVGGLDGNWTKARDPQWLPIAMQGATVPHGTLAREFICKDSRVPGKPEAIINDLRYHRTPFSPQT